MLTYVITIASHAVIENYIHNGLCGLSCDPVHSNAHIIMRLLSLYPV